MVFLLSILLKSKTTAFKKDSNNCTTLEITILYIITTCVCVCLCVRRRFRVLIDAVELARTVGQFRILMDRRNRAGQIVWPSRRNSQGEETDRSFGLADEILKAKRRTDRSA
jgi:hypothetical protein